MRTYPLVDEDNNPVPNAYVLATEEYTKGFDYNDIVVIVRNVEPTETGDDGEEPPQAEIPVPASIPADGIPGLSLRNPLGIPYDDRLVLQKIVKTTGNFCDPTVEPGCKDPSIDRWKGMQFPTPASSNSAIRARPPFS